MHETEGGILDSKTITLVPMEESHKAELSSVLNFPEVWEYTWRNVTGREDIVKLLDIALEYKEKGSQLPYTIIEKTTGKIVGTTRIGDIDKINKSVEIGWTWLSPKVWRSSVNTECKYTLLQFCFEELKMIRVQFSVSGQNTRSQRAVERIGATKEGVFRMHRIKPDGSIHDNIFYSIIEPEWPKVKAHVQDLMTRKYE